jgi:hypothetical protein
MTHLRVRSPLAPRSFNTDGAIRFLDSGRRESASDALGYLLSRQDHC